jgi:hypothetical protein
MRHKLRTFPAVTHCVSRVCCQIGGTVALDALFGGPVSGASMNPARSLGPALVALVSTQGPLLILSCAVCPSIQRLCRAWDERVSTYLWLLFKVWVCRAGQRLPDLAGRKKGKGKDRGKYHEGVGFVKRVVICWKRMDRHEFNVVLSITTLIDSD